MKFLGAQCELTDKELNHLEEHEKRAVEEIKQNGLYF